ncbi:nuclear transport factor 2 family protein [Streptomyces yatensis]|uniref:SnoaL-like domain-containing protein n=1 Tax=Streptomyces yatensis TaxID=155177 RepID=A0ABN2J5K5_9ACTN|nr:nuclear transport factor 2 family protein [Streptomyces yatensis]
MNHLLDRAAIHDLNTRYAVAFDGFRLNESSGCWAEDGVLDERETGFGLFQGREAIRDFFRDSLFAHARNVIHIMFNHLVTDIEGNRAAGSVSCLVEVVKNDGGYVRSHVKYEDEYIRVDGQWKFGSRVIKPSFPGAPS